QIVSRIRDAFQVELPLKELFDKPTVALLAQSIEEFKKESGTAKKYLSEIKHETGKRVFPLSQEQKRIWVIEQMHPDGSMFNVPAALEISGLINRKVLEKSTEIIINKHEILRSVFSNDHGIPKQKVQEIKKFKIIYHDLSGQTSKLKNKHKDEIINKHLEESFDLLNGPLLKIILIKTSAKKHLLIMIFHHIIADGWSIPIFVQELSVIYNQLLTGINPEIKNASLQYYDYALWQNKWLKKEVIENQIAYWKNELKDYNVMLDLPTDNPRKPEQTFNGGTVKMDFDHELSSKLKAFCRKESLTVYMVLLSAFQILLHKYSSNNDIIIGTPLANRNHPATENMIGFFVNTLVVRSIIQKDEGISKFLGQIRDKVLNMFANQDVSLDMVLEELKVKRDLSHSPLFQVAFVFQNLPEYHFDLPGLKISTYDIISKTVKYDIILTMTEQDGKYIAYWEYNTDLFSGATINRLARHLSNIVENIIENSQQKIANIQMLSKEESSLICYEWNKTECVYQEEIDIPKIFRDKAKAFPESVALTYFNGHAGNTEKKMTYRELDLKSDMLALYLQTRGVNRETKVGILIPRSLEMVIAVLAVFKSGGVFIPLDPSYPEDRIHYMLEDSETQFVISTEQLAKLMDDWPVKVICLDKDFFESENSGMQISPSYPDNLAYIIYTSGSTGRPKGVMLTNRGLYNLALSQQKIFNLGAGKKVLQFSSLSFDASVWEIVMALLSGAALCIVDKELILSAHDLVRVIEKLNITTVTLPPSILVYLNNEKNNSTWRLPQLETIIAAGEKCPKSLANKWNKSHKFYNAYGPTEITVCATIFECKETSKQDPPIGSPIYNMKSYVLNEEMQIQPIGVPGELYVGGEGIARGYLNRPDLTAVKFVPDPFSDIPGARLYKTGDKVKYLSDGILDFIGRLDTQIKLRGYRIELSEIESALLMHPSIKGTVVTIQKISEENQNIIAYIVTGHNDIVNPRDLKEFIKKYLPEYMIPSRFVLVEQ
ncbi:MAG: amino acid adenylation domain-containing protein, partial [Methanococcaceae archaeon]